MQYCSLNDPDLYKIDTMGAHAIAWAQRVVTHLALHAARVDSVAAGADALLEDFLQDGFMKDFPLLRGE